MIEIELRTFDDRIRTSNFRTIDYRLSTWKWEEGSGENGQKPGPEQPEKPEHRETTISTRRSKGLCENHPKMQKRKTSIFITYKS